MRVGRAELLRNLQRLRPQIDRDDPLAAGNRRALHDVEADAAGADDRDARSLRHLAGVDHRADAGDHRAADRRQRVERHVARHRNRAAFGDDDEIGEAGGAEERRHVLAARVQPRRAGRQLVAERHLLDAIAQHRATFEARRADAARRRPAEHDVIAGLRPCVTDGADLAHDAGAFVAEHERRLGRPVAARRMQIAVADAGGLESRRALRPGPGASSSAASTESGCPCSHKIAA